MHVDHLIKAFESLINISEDEVINKEIRHIIQNLKDNESITIDVFQNIDSQSMCRIVTNIKIK